MRPKRRTAASYGTTPEPQLPTTSVVTPCITLKGMVGSRSTAKSSWLCTSMKPGATAIPRASISVRPRSVTTPTAEIRSAVSATSAGTPGAPLPSNTIPPRSTTSNVAIGQGSSARRRKDMVKGWRRLAPFHGERGIRGPLRERGVVDGDVVATEEGECERIARGRDAAAAVRYHALRIEGARCGKLCPQRIVREIRVGLGIDEVAGRHVARAGDASGSPIADTARAAMLLLGERVEHARVRLAEGSEDAPAIRHEVRPKSRREVAWRSIPLVGGGQPSLAGPLLPAPVQDGRAVEAEHAQHPPDARRPHVH